LTCPDFGSAGKQAVLARDKKDKAFGGGTIRTATDCKCSKTKSSRKRLKKKEALYGIF